MASLVAHPQIVIKMGANPKFKIKKPEEGSVKKILTDIQQAGAIWERVKNFVKVQET